MARFLMIAYTTYMHDGRVKRHAEALAERGDHVDVICLRDRRAADHQRRQRDRSADAALSRREQIRLSQKLHCGSFRWRRSARRGMSMKQRYDVVIVCTMPDAVIVCAILPKFLGSKVVLDVHDTMPELYRDKFGGARGAAGAKLLMLEETGQLVVGGSRSRRARSASRPPATSGRARRQDPRRDELAGYEDLRPAQKRRRAPESVHA